MAALIRNEQLDPKHAKITVGLWCVVRLEGHGTNRPSTVPQARGCQNGP